MFIALIVAILLGFAVQLLLAWPAMLLFGVVHADVWSVIPAFSFWDTVIISILVGLLTSNTNVNSN